MPRAVRAGRLAAALAAVGLALAPAACGGGDDDPEGAASRSAPAVTIESFTFKPATLAVTAGTTVTWTNRDGFAHAIRPDDNLFPTSTDIQKDQSFSHTYDKPGTYPYICGIHNSMAGRIVVR